MGAPKGNQFWKIRTKHGRDKMFATPELLWEQACNYFDWCDKNPFKKQEAKVVSAGAGAGSEIEYAEVDVMRPYSWEGLCRYLNVARAYFNQFKKQKEASEGLSTVIESISEVIITQQFSGAASGFFNGNIVSRYLGLIDKTQTDTTNKNYNSEPLSKDEMKQIAKDLEDEI